MKLRITVPVRYRDIDSMGHVNNAVYLSYFEQARIGYFMEAIGGEWNWTEHGTIVARHEIDYLRPILLNDTVFIDTYIESAGESSFIMCYEVYNQKNKMCTKGKTVLVCYDFRAQKKSPVPEKWKALVMV
ncbi:MAG: acyl-CoA thioesterase [Flavobacteriales bacterium]